MKKYLPNVSELQIERAKFKPILPETFKSGVSGAKPVLGKETNSIADQEKIKEIFSNTYGLPSVLFKKGTNSTVVKKTVKVGVVLSGGQAPGGHNVIAGIFDGLKKANKKNVLIGFLGGASGILENKYKVISETILSGYRNTGGFDFIQSGRTKIETAEQFLATKTNCLKNKLDALIVVGGDDSNTNAALIAEYAKKENIPVSVVGVPKTIDGDLKNKYVETSFGFDTATKIYSELVGNICRDVNSAQKYWHFVRLMGRSASHITLEVAFKTQPNVTLIGEEVLSQNMTLAKVVESAVDVIVRRSEKGKNFGVVLVPEGLIEFIPEMKELISSLNDVLAENSDTVASFNSIEQKKEFVFEKLPQKLSDLMKSLPSGIASQLMLDRDPHGNVQVSLIETEKLLIEMIRKELSKLKAENKYRGKFSAITHFFGYEGRCGSPSNFDAVYAYALGYNAAALVLNGFTGYLSSVRNLTKPSKQWECGGIPLTMMMNIEKRHGKEKPVIQKALVDLNGKPFREFVKKRDKWAMSENYIFPGPIQFFGPEPLTNMTTRTLQYEHSSQVQQANATPLIKRS
jgi:pyrophosphate--fructose-6-phosphate 1-phosphotransferase